MLNMLWKGPRQWGSIVDLCILGCAPPKLNMWRTIFSFKGGLGCVKRKANWIKHTISSNQNKVELNSRMYAVLTIVIFCFSNQQMSKSGDCVGGIFWTTCRDCSAGVLSMSSLTWWNALIGARLSSRIGIPNIISQDPKAEEITTCPYFRATGIGSLCTGIRNHSELVLPHHLKHYLEYFRILCAFKSFHRLPTIIPFASHHSCIAALVAKSIICSSALVRPDAPWDWTQVSAGHFQHILQWNHSSTLTCMKAIHVRARLAACVSGSETRLYYFLTIWDIIWNNPELFVHSYLYINCPQKSKCFSS